MNKKNYWQCHWFYSYNNRTCIYEHGTKKFGRNRKAKKERSE